MRDDLTVAEAAEAIGTSPQTIRTLLRKGELRGRKQPKGKRFVWVPSRRGVDEFLSQYGRLEGRRRSRGSQAPQAEEAVEFVDVIGDVEEPPLSEPLPLESMATSSDQLPLLLRPRVRATAFILVVGFPLISVLVAAQILPDALWFDELGQLDVFRGVLAARLTLYVLVVGGVSLFVGANLAIAAWRADIVRSRAVGLAIPAASLVVGTFFAASAGRHWVTFLLWRHQQSFGVMDPMFGKDLGFFVFSLPFQLVVSGFLLTLIAVAIGFVAIIYRAGGGLAFRPLRVHPAARTHLSLLAAGFLLVVSWRFILERYALVLTQPVPDEAQPFAGAHFVDVHVRSPGLAVMAALGVVLAIACVAAPVAFDRTSKRAVALMVGLPASALVIAALSINSWIPALVQRYAVDPNPVLSERPFLMRSIAATRSGLGLDGIKVEPYSPSGQITPADVSEARDRIGDVLIWDQAVVHARMLDLVTQTPYYRPQEPTLDAVPIDGRRQPTLASTRQLDISRVSHQGDTWINDRLVYTHGLGLVRFSGTDIDENRQPRLLDDGLELRQPRIYFGEFPKESPSWVVTDTRRPEVDIPTSAGEHAAAYHYGGSGGIELSSWIRRAMFAVKLGSKDLLLSDDISSQSRILLHRDVHERLRTLAPFIQWDARSASLAANGRIVYVVAGYTTSESYPYAERVDLGGASVNYARSSVLATVDAFSGQVALYVTDTADPVLRAWAEVFPTLFLSEDELPAWLGDRLRYPADLFDAQATVYERFHVTQPSVFASDADIWSRPTSLSGAIEVAGDINFDEDDEDELRNRLQPAYKLASPPGQGSPRLVLSTYFSPNNGQNLVASMDGWVDDNGQSHLVAHVLPRDPITLGPAQVSRLVFATPRVRNLLGLRNLELRDLDKSSIDTVSLGNPHILFLPGGVLQIQSLYEGASGQGVSRILGVTAFLNGRAGLGPDIESAVRQALHKPPRIDVQRPAGPLFVGTPVELSFRVSNAESEVMSITSPAGREEVDLSVEDGHGTFVWLPSAPGHARVHVLVQGIDGSVAFDNVSLRVLSPSPTARFITVPTRAVVGQSVRVPFRVTNSRRETVTVSTRGGVIERRYLLRNGQGFIRWKPQTPGLAVIRITTHGLQGQIATDTARLLVVRRRYSESEPGSVPTSVSTPIDRASAAIERTETRFADHRIWRALDALATLRQAVLEAHKATIAQIGKPAVSVEPPGPPSVMAVLDLEHRVGVRVPPNFDGLTREQVVDSLRHTLWVTQGRRDRMLDIVIALDQEGAGTDYAAGMAATLPAFTNEINALRMGLDSYVLTASGRASLTSALERVRATRDRVSEAFGVSGRRAT
jgi:uncharacterized membrane protein (UPF0182 family)